MHKFFILIFSAAIGVGVWFGWENFKSLPQLAQMSLPSTGFKTLEIRFSAEEIMLAHKSELLKNPGHAFLEPRLLFYPHLLMEVKYAKSPGLTNEGILLWDLYGGEAVTQTSSWEKTHGFEDCLSAKADKNDFKIIEALATHGSALNWEELYNLFNVDPDIIDHWVESCRNKKLIATCGNTIRLHFQNPRLLKEPITSFDRAIVTLNSKKAHRVKARYSVPAIKKLSQIAFGSDFAIRRTQEVFLPVYSIEVQNPDGSVLTTYWNAVNGNQL